MQQNYSLNLIYLLLSNSLSSFTIQNKYSVISLSLRNYSRLFLFLDSWYILFPILFNDPDFFQNLECFLSFWANRIYFLFPHNAFEGSSFLLGTKNNNLSDSNGWNNFPLVFMVSEVIECGIFGLEHTFLVDIFDDDSFNKVFFVHIQEVVPNQNINILIVSLGSILQFIVWPLQRSIIRNQPFRFGFTCKTSIDNGTLLGWTEYY